MAVFALSNRGRIGLLAALAILAATAPAVALSSADNLLDPATFVLAALSVASVLGRSKLENASEISAAFVCFMLAVAFLGPVPAFAVAAVTELVVWAVERYRKPMLAINIASTAVPALLAGYAFRGLAGGDDMLENTTADIVALAATGTGFLVLNFLLLHVLSGLYYDERLRDQLRFPRELAPSVILTIALTLAIAGIYAEYGVTAGIFIVLILIAFSYMSRLVIIARERTGQYAALSWGVLSALVRSLDRRDARTARHSAAVAAFARDIALHTGMSHRDAELAHTAGLLHDIGRFALPDRVMEREGALTDSDWDAIQRHPELGAELLADLGVYGPVAEIVRAHHERIDGRGYPDGLKGDAIPEIARIVAVAEVYDTLTAEDTYRERMTSFQALTEMRRVAGKQLDGRYVEALSELLAGRGLDYRHADRADFDVELAIERRIAESVSPDPAAGGGLIATAGEPGGVSAAADEPTR